MNWNDYEVFDPGVDRPLNELPRAVATMAYLELMAVKNHRVDQLRRLAAANGIDIDAESGLRDLNRWFDKSVSPSASNPQRLESRWYSVVNDIALLLGDQIVERSGQTLRWQLCKGERKNVSYQRPVIVGFEVKNANYNLDLDLLVGMYGHRLLQGQPANPDYFESLVTSAIARAPGR
ncbi:MAG TPA: hypothetical protein VMV46_10600 [Thermoanaerobaculia bacterium]|nr:hypothetical protein [Thermoanaerobaculia bacterium]